MGSFTTCSPVSQWWRKDIHRLCWGAGACTKWAKRHMGCWGCLPIAISDTT